MNVVADGLSRASEGTKHEKKDGSEWTVLEDWETRKGLSHDIIHTSIADTQEMAMLRDRFKDKPIFAEVIDAMLKLDQGVSLKLRK